MSVLSLFALNAVLRAIRLYIQCYIHTLQLPKLFPEYFLLNLIVAIFINGLTWSETLT